MPALGGGKFGSDKAAKDAHAERQAAEMNADVIAGFERRLAAEVAMDEIDRKQADDDGS